MFRVTFSDEAFSPGRWQTTLEALQFSNSTVSSEALRAIQRATALEYLVVMHADGAIKHLSQFASIESLTHLILIAIPIEDDAEGIDLMQNLTFLRAQHSMIGDRVAARLATLPNLRGLDLAQTRLTDAGLRTLEASPSLRWLRVQDTEISFQGIRCFQEAMPECKLVY
jgi:hypothetical protein